MERTFKIEKELKITTENIVDCVLSCEAGGFDYWGELCSDEKDYEAARQRLAEREKADMKPCYEDVLAEILESGGKLTVYDREDDKDHELTLEKLLNGWKKYAEDHNADDFDEVDSEQHAGYVVQPWPGCRGKNHRQHLPETQLERAGKVHR